MPKSSDVPIIAARRKFWLAVCYSCVLSWIGSYPMTRLFIFDDGKGRWGPLTDRRAVFELRTGAVTTLERIERVTGLRAAGLIVPPRLQAVVAERYPQAAVNGPIGDGHGLMINGRCSRAQTLDCIATPSGPTAWVQDDDQVVAALLDRDTADGFQTSGFVSIPGQVTVHRLPGRVLIERPWHILDELEVNLKSDLDASEIDEWNRVGDSVSAFGDHPVRVADDAVVQPAVVFNTEQGPVVVDHHAVIAAAAVLEGPCYIGRGSHVACHAHIRPGTVIGPGCKVGGEVSQSIIQGYTNKAHYGYLGCSLVGQWVNLGAGTTVSNLKNTYSPVRALLEPGAEPEDTGRVYQGPILGDFVRTAIGTRLLTGACVGTGSMISVSGLVAKWVERFRFVNDQGDRPYDIEKFITTARVMMDLKSQRLIVAEEELLRQLFRGIGDNECG